MPATHCQIALPATFRITDLLEFHGRDPQAFAEKVGFDFLEKGLIWNGEAANLRLKFQVAHVDAELAIDGRSTATEDEIRMLVRRLLGLTQDIEKFEQNYHQHPQLGPLIIKQSGLRVPLAATPFEALTWAITGQQISLGAAVSLRRKLIKACGLIHSSGLACYPNAERLGKLSLSDIRTAGFSANKAQTLMTLSTLILSGKLPIDTWLSTEKPADLPVDEIRQRLLDIRGIGPWTVNYALLRGFGWLDGSLHGDSAVRRSMQTLLGHPEKISETDAQQWLAQFSPWRALLAAHLWAMRPLATSEIPLRPAQDK